VSVKAFVPPEAEAGWLVDLSAPLLSLSPSSATDGVFRENKPIGRQCECGQD
jgi:hypothetical protein